MKAIIIKTIGCECGWRVPYNKELLGTLCKKCNNGKIKEIKDLDKMIVMNVAGDQELDNEIEKIENAKVKNDLPDISTIQKKNQYIQQRKKEMADALKKIKAIEYMKINK